MEESKRKYNIKEIKEIIFKISPNIIILSNEYKTAKTKMECVCKIDNHKWAVSWDTLKKGVGCPACKNKAVHDGNSIYKNRPDLIKYFVNKEDIYKYSISSGKTVMLQCPDCGSIKNMAMTTLNRYGLG